MLNHLEVGGPNRPRPATHLEVTDMDQVSKRLRAACGRPKETYFARHTWVNDKNRSVWTVVLRVGAKKRAVGDAVTVVGGGLSDLGGFCKAAGVGFVAPAAFCGLGA